MNKRMIEESFLNFLSQNIKHLTFGQIYFISFPKNCNYNCNLFSGAKHNQIASLISFPLALFRNEPREVIITEFLLPRFTLI